MLTLTPEIKPNRWNVQRAFITPQWDFVWDGLTHAYLMWERGGTIIRNYVNGELPGTLDNVSRWTRPAGSSRGVIGLDFNPAGAHVDLNGNFGFGASGQPFTIAIAFRTPNNVGSSGDNQIIGRFGNGKLFQLGHSNANLRVAYGVSPFDAILGSDVVLANFVFYLGVFTYDASTKGELWVAELNGPDGATHQPRGLINLGSNAVVTGAFDDTTELHIGRRGGDSAEEFDGEVYGVWAWDRKLPDRMLQQFATDPFGAFRLDPRIIGKAPAVGGFFNRRYYDEFLGGKAA